MEARKNDKALYSHTRIENDVSQPFVKVLYAVENLRRRWTLELASNLKTVSTKDVRKYFKEKGVTGKTSTTTIRDFVIKPLVEAETLKEQENESFKITPFGEDLNEVISGLKELDLLPIPTRRKFYSELILLELRDGKKTYKELKSKLDLPDPYKVIKRLKDAGFIKVNHPENLIYAPHLFRFSISPYYPFVEGIKSYTEKTSRSWFTEYSIIRHLNLKWQNIFGRSMEINEVRKLLKKGIENGDITKTDGSYEASIKDLTALIRDLTGDLTPSEKKILNLVKEGYVHCSKIAEKIGFHWASVHRILGRLEKKNLVEKDVEGVTIELTEKGKNLADSLFKIEECVAREVGWQV